MEQCANREATAEPRDWGCTDEELARAPTGFRPDLLTGKVYLVSGGGSGMGLGMAYLLARLGADVMICGRRADKLDQTAVDIRQHRQHRRDRRTRHAPGGAHLRSPRGCNLLTKTVATEWAPLNIRVNCVAPGSIATEGLNAYPDGATEKFASTNPMKRLGDNGKPDYFKVD